MKLRISTFSMMVSILCVIFTFLYLNSGIKFKNISFNNLNIATLYVKINKSLIVNIINATIDNSNITFNTTFRYSIGDSFSTLHIYNFNSNIIYSKMDISIAVDIGDLFNYKKGVFRGHIHVIDLLIKMNKNSKYALLQKKNATIYYNAKIKNNTIEIFSKNPKLHYLFKDGKHFLKGKDDANLILSYLSFVKPIGKNNNARANITIELANTNNASIDYKNFKIYAEVYNLSLNINSSVFASNTSLKEFPYGVLIHLNNAMMIYDDIPARYDNATLFMNRHIFRVDGLHKRTKGILVLTKKSNNTFLYIEVNKAYDKDINLFYNETIFDGGEFNLVLNGDIEDKLNARITAYNTKMLNNQQLNTINALSKTLTLTTYGALTLYTAGIATPLLLTDLDLTVDGYPITKAKLFVEYPTSGGRIFIKNLNIQNKGSNLQGFLDYNLTKSTMKGKLQVSYLKTLSDILSTIPIIKQITTGSDGKFSTIIYIKGNTKNPTITTNIIKNTIEQTADSSIDIVKMPASLAEEIKSSIQTKQQSEN